MTTMTTLTSSAPASASKRDNLFGVCHAIGESFGFDPLYVRLAFVASVLVDFEMALAVYAALAVVVALVRR